MVNLRIKKFVSVLQKQKKKKTEYPTYCGPIGERRQQEKLPGSGTSEKYEDLGRLIIRARDQVN